MTTQQLYQKTINEEMSSSDFLWNVRRNPQYYNIINGLMSFEDTVNVLKGRGHIWENSKESVIKPFSLTGTIKLLNEAAKSNKQPKVTADMVNYYEFTKGWKKELEKNDDLDKAKEKAIANIVKDPNYYTRIEMEAYQKSKSKKESKNLPIDISKKNANYKDDANQMQKLDKAKPKSNVEDGLAKKEKAKSKSAGLKSMKGGYPQMKKINEDIGDTPFDRDVAKELSNLTKKTSKKADSKKVDSKKVEEPKESPEEIKRRLAKEKYDAEKQKENSIEIPKEIKELPSGVKIKVRKYQPVYVTGKSTDGTIKTILKIIPKDRIEIEGEFKGYPDVDNEKKLSFFKGDYSSVKWVDRELTKEQMISIHKKSQKEQLSIGQNPLYKIIIVPKNSKKTIAPIPNQKSEIDPTSKPTKDNPSYSNSFKTLNTPPPKQTKALNKKVTDVPIPDNSDILPINDINTDYDFYVVNKEKNIGAGYRDINKARFFIEKNKEYGRQVMRKPEFLKYKQEINTFTYDTIMSPNFKTNYSVNNKQKKDDLSKETKSTKSKIKDYEVPVTIGKFRRKLKEDNLLESIIRKKIKSFLKENEIGKYIGVEGSDVKKKD